jgi:DNA-binding transcriptional regulator LsrR (DeoR family)
MNNIDDVMVRAAWLYYEARLTHEEIADELHMSRVAVTRLLQRARQEGVVRITITRPLPAEFELEVRLKKAFHLKSAVVVSPGASPADTLENIGLFGAQLLSRLITPGSRVGVAWSSTLAHLANYLEKNDPLVPFTVHELAGTFLGPATPYGIAWRVAEKMGVPLESLPVPVFVQSREAYDALMKEERIRLALQHATEVDIAMVGLGNLCPDCTLVQTGFLTPEQTDIFKNQGVVGDILMRFYDEHGNPVHTPQDGQVISLTIEQIRRIPHVIAVATGETKIAPIIGALRGRLVQGLVTDTETARQVLAYTGMMS